MNAEICLMLIDNQVKTYDDFKSLNKEVVYLLDWVKTNGATTRFRNHHAMRVNDTLEWISYLEESGQTAVVDDPITKWVNQDYERWKRRDKPSGSMALTITKVTNLVTATTTATEIQQKLTKTSFKLGIKENQTQMITQQ